LSSMQKAGFDIDPKSRISALAAMNLSRSFSKESRFQ
jgi:hypothetical protein